MAWGARAFENVVNAISPLRLFQAEQAGKLASEAGLGKLMGGQHIQDEWRAIRQGYQANGGSMWSDWFSGHDLSTVQSAIKDGSGMKGLMANKEYVESMARNSLYRKVAVGAVGAATVGKMMMGNNLVTDAGDSAVSAGIGFGAAGAFLHRGYSTGGVGAKLLGWGTAGLTARNMMSSGDDWGPG